MNALLVRTDGPGAELALYNGTTRIAHERWPADRTLAETIHNRIETLLREAATDMTALQGIGVYRGPGSFTGLRIGITVANTLAYGLNIPVAGATGADWEAACLRELVRGGVPGGQVVPAYGAPVHITAPRK